MLTSTEFCQRLGIDRYPSLYFFGYGNFHQKIENLTLAEPLSQHIARYEGELYLDALYDWVKLLSTFSFVDRTYDSIFTSFLNPMASSVHRKKIKILDGEVSNLKQELHVATEKINEYETIKLFESLKLEGDVFRVMTQESPKDSNLAFRVCVSELANEYCRYIKDDPYCLDDLPHCSKIFFESQKCRPKECPMKPLGCRVTSTCLRENVVDEFQNSFDNK